MRFILLLALLPSLAFAQDTLFIGKRERPTGNIIGIKNGLLYLTARNELTQPYELKTIDSIAVAATNPNKNKIDSVFAIAKPLQLDFGFECAVHNGEDLFTKRKFVATYKGAALGTMAFNYSIDATDTLILLHKTNTVHNATSINIVSALLTTWENFFSNKPVITPNDSLVIATAEKSYVFRSAGTYSTLQDPTYSITTFNLDAAYRIPYAMLKEMVTAKPIAARISTSVGNFDFTIENRALRQLRNNAVCIQQELLYSGSSKR